MSLLLSNAIRTDVPSIAAAPSIDISYTHLVIPDQIREKLQLLTFGFRDILLADDTWHRVPYVGPIHVQFKNRSAFVGATVMGNDIVLGLIPMEDMDLLPLSEKNVRNEPDHVALEARN